MFIYKNSRVLTSCCKYPAILFALKHLFLFYILHDPCTPLHHLCSLLPLHFYCYNENTLRIHWNLRLYIIQMLSFYTSYTLILNTLSPCSHQLSYKIKKHLPSKGKCFLLNIIKGKRNIWNNHTRNMVLLYYIYLL